MRTTAIPLLVLVLASSGSFSVGAETKANTDYEAAEKAAKDAETAAANAAAELPAPSVLPIAARC